MAYPLRSGLTSKRDVLYGGRLSFTFAKPFGQTGSNDGLSFYCTGVHVSLGA